MATSRATAKQAPSPQADEQLRAEQAHAAYDNRRFQIRLMDLVWAWVFAAGIIFSCLLVSA